MINKEDNEENVKKQVAALINAALDEIDSGAAFMDGEEFFNLMKEKYVNNKN